ncbi:MAG: phosphopantetheine-binding protein [Actinomycetota bacterium]|nr:phosphopantetheine-binding protein [Actinomycetota bacterium]
MQDDVTVAITKIFCELGIEPAAITETATLGDELELDSTDAVEVSLGLKRRFGVEVKVQVKGDLTVADLHDAVLTAMKEQTAAG